MILFTKLFSKKFAAKPRLDGLEYPGFTRRYFSTVIDMLLLFGISSFTITIASYLGRFFIDYDSSLVSRYNLGIELSPQEIMAVKKVAFWRVGEECVQVSLIFLYFSFFWYWIGSTPGKLITGLQIVSSDGLLLTKKQVLRRSLGGIFTSLTCMLGYFYAFFDKNKQSTHDKIADTIIVTRRSLKDAGMLKLRFDVIRFFKSKFYEFVRKLARPKVS